MDRTAQDERRAFLGFVRAHEPLLRRYLHRRLRYYQDLGLAQRGDPTPDDMLNETVVAAARRLPEKRPDLGYYPWFRRVADTVLRRQAQRSATHRRRTMSLEHPVGYTEDGEPIRLQDILPDPHAVLPAEALEQRELQEVLECAVRRLPDDWREALLLHAIDGYSLLEVAALEGRPPDVIREDIRLARDYLREALASGRIVYDQQVYEARPSAENAA